MNINAIRKVLYALARLLGDVNAVQQSVKQSSPKPVVKRVLHKAAGRTYGRSAAKWINKL